jgi:hypothetical protein
MVLFENSVIKLDYNPASDILEVAYPDLHDYLISEIKSSINVLVNTVTNYDVKKVLLDSSKTVISVSEQESREVATYLATGLIKTRTKKLARVQSASAYVENTANSNIQHIQNSLPLPYEVRNFSNKASACAWLME